MPFGGLVVNRVHPLDGGAAGSRRRGADRRAGRRRRAGRARSPRAYAEERALAERDDAAIEHLRARDRRAGPDRHPPARRRRPRRRRPRGDPRPPVRRLMARDSRPTTSSIVGGGHNGLVAAAYLARAGRSVLVLERRDHARRRGGLRARRSPGVDARLSRYAYLVSLLPQRIVDELGLPVRARAAGGSRPTRPPARPGARPARRRRGPRRDRGARFARSRRRPGGHRRLGAPVRDDAPAWRAARVPDDDRAAAPAARAARAGRRRRGLGRRSFERPLGEPIADALRRRPASRGSSLTDALIGTFAAARRRRPAPEPLLPLPRDRQRHRRLGRARRRHGRASPPRSAAPRAAAGAELRDRRRGDARSSPTAGRRRGALRRRRGGEHARARGHVLANAAPAVLDRLLGRAAVGPTPEGAQLKVNLLLARLPRLRDAAVDPAARPSPGPSTSTRRLRAARARLRAGRRGRAARRCRRARSTATR